MAQNLRPPSGVHPSRAPDDLAQSDDASGPATVDAVVDSVAPKSRGGDDHTHSRPSAVSAGAAKGPLSVPSQPRIGVPRSLQRWDRYQVISVLGSGGMGAVYKVRDPRLNRFVALKIVHPMLGHGQSSTGDFFVKRFVREARIQASLDHSHICKVYEIGELPGHDGESGYPYIAMQLISGKPLQLAHLEMSLFEKVRVIQQVAEALHAAHRQGLIHRDIKPRKGSIERE